MARGIQSQASSSKSTTNSLSQHVLNDEQRDHNPGLPNRSGLILPLNPLTLHSTADREVTVEGGRVLFGNFIREEFEHEGFTEEYLLSPPEAGDAPVGVIPDHTASNQGTSSGYRMNDPFYGEGITYDNISAAASTPEGYKNVQWSRYGREIRELADKFSESKERQDVMRTAAGVNLEDIDQERFFELLEELFIHGFSRERLIALFFFCSDLLIRAIRENKRDICKSLFIWSLQYMSNRVCQWVQENGGWEKVLGNLWNAVFKVVFVSALVVGIAAGIVYIKKNW